MTMKNEFKTATPNSDIENVHNIDVLELASKLGLSGEGKLDSEGLILVDVRMPQEFTGELGHIKGAQLIPLPALPEHLSELPKDATIVFVCRSGGRSAQASAFALSNGYLNTFNMMGGMMQWTEHKLPIES